MCIPKQTHLRAQLQRRTVLPARTASRPYFDLPCKGDHSSVMWLKCPLQIALAVDCLAGNALGATTTSSSQLLRHHRYTSNQFVKLTDRQADKSPAAVEQEAGYTSRSSVLHIKRTGNSRQRRSDAQGCRQPIACGLVRLLLLHVHRRHTI